MNQFAAIKAAFHQMLGPDIGIGVVDPKTPGAVLLPEEEPAMTRVVAKRQLEFTAGRTATRQTMKDLGILRWRLRWPWIAALSSRMVW